MNASKLAKGLAMVADAIHKNDKGAQAEGLYLAAAAAEEPEAVAPAPVADPPSA